MRVITSKYKEKAVGRRAVMLVFVALAGSGACLAATITMGTTTCKSGATGVEVPVALDSAHGEEVASLQLDIIFDGDALSVADVTVGPVAAAADKNISLNTLEPGKVRVLVLGLNGNVIEDGVIANLLLDVSAGAEGLQTVSWGNVVLSNPYGVAVAAQGVPGSVRINAGSAEGEGEGGTTGGCSGGTRGLRADTILPLLLAVASLAHYASRARRDQSYDE